VTTSSKTISKAFRVVVCAAILTGSLFGPALHEFQHALESAAGSQGHVHSDPASQSRGGKSLCRPHSHSPSDHSHSGVPHERSADSEKPAPGHHEHDSSNCAICYVLGLQLSRTEVVQLQSRLNTVREVVVHANEYADGLTAVVATARGPPGSV